MEQKKRRRCLSAVGTMEQSKGQALSAVGTKEQKVPAVSLGHDGAE